jgi:hypothetical protein
MTITSSGQIAVSDVLNERGWVSGSFAWLNGEIKAAQRPGSPNLNSFHGLAFYQRNVDGNCANNGANCDYNCNCNCGNIQCNNCANCTAVNCANCDAQQWLQTNCNCACTYNCNSNQNCFSYNCNCSKIICTKLYEYGLMPKDIFEADQAFGAKLIETNPDIYNGYRAWAEIVVEWMEGKGPKMMPWMSDEEFSVAAKNWSTTWAQDIATPWAEEMAYMMGAKESGSLTGKMMFAFGIPICKVIGVWQRWFGPSKKKAGFAKGAGLVVIFVMFKLIAELGRFIERFIPKKGLV